MEKIIDVAEYGIIPETDVSVKLNELLKNLADIEGHKELKFPKGVYYLNSENVPKPTLYITNTIGDNEWRLGEVRHKNAVGIYLKDIKNITFDGNGSTFLICGQMTNVAAVNCENIELKNFNIITENPDMHEFKVVGKGPGYVDYQLDDESRYVFDKKFYFVGKDFKSAFNENRAVAWWTAKIPFDEPDTIFRVKHPLCGAIGIKETAPRKFRVKYFIAPSCEIGDLFYIFDNRRKYQGIFADSCKNIVLSNISQHFNYGLSTVFQACENISITECRFCPAVDSAKKMISVADFIQVCMCSGLASIKNNYFEGAGDDCLNVHGIYFKVISVNNRKITVKFKHRQTHGFCPFKKGDKIRFLSPMSLCVIGENEVASARLINEKTIVIDLTERVGKKYLYKVIENASACPDVVFSDNTLTRIITRGILLTTSGKILVENNKFMSNSMHSILISNDARMWYESGFVNDVTIRNNYFGRCLGYTLFIKPENIRFNGYVHKNIKFINNTIESHNGNGGFFVKDSENVVLADNTVIGKIKPSVYKNSLISEQ